MALVPGSDAIDGGDDAVCPATDQRGVERPQSAHCDVGAFEVAHPDAGGPYTGDEAAPIVMSSASASGPAGLSLSYAWSIVPAGCSFDDTGLLNPTLTCTDNGVFTATLSVDDGVNSPGSSAAQVTVLNVAPEVEAGADQIVLDSFPVSFTGVYTDPGSLDTHTIAWDFGAGPPVTGTLTPTHTFPSPGTYTVTLTVTDNDGGEGRDTLNVMVQPVSDLSLAMSAAPEPVLAGAELVYSLAAHNHGPSAAAAVTITATLPGEVSFSAASPGCGALGGNVICDLGTLSSGMTTTLQITTTVAPDFQGMLASTGLIAAAEPDPDPGNNTASTTASAVLTQPVFEDDFENAPILSPWDCATPNVATTPMGARHFLGEFGAGTVCLNLDGLSQHAFAHVEFDLYLIRSWDGNQVDPPANALSRTNEAIGPDPWLFKAAGTTLLDTTFSNWTFQRQAFPGSYPGGDYPGLTGAQEINTLGYTYTGVPQDAVYHLSFTFAHTGSTLDLEFISQQLQDVLDESWGLDNVTVWLSMSDRFVQTYTLYLPLVNR